MCRSVAWIVVLLIAGSFGRAADGPDRSRRVRSARVEVGRPAQFMRFSSMTRPERQTALSFTVGGRLRSRVGPVGIGVEAQDVLARIEAGPLENAALDGSVMLSRAKIEWRRLRRERGRTERLMEVGGTASREMDLAVDAERSAWAQVVSAQARLAEAERQLDEASLRAPYAGRIVEILVESGEYVSPGVPVLVLNGDGRLEIEFSVPESIVSQLRLGQRVDLAFPLSDAPPTTATIRSIVYAAGVSGALYPVIARLADDSGLLAGMSVEAIIETEGDMSLLVPVDAVVDATGRDASVFRISHGRAERVPVTVLSVHGNRVAVRGDLRKDDPVIVAGHLSLLDGEAVHVELPASPGSR